MKAAYYHQHGDADVLQVGELPIPPIADDEVLVQVAAAGINPIDRRLRAGELQEYISRTFPVVPGWDFAGRIVDVGAEVSDYKPGDDVVGLAFTWSIQHGTNAEFVPVQASSLTRKPANISFEEAASLPLVSLTAWQSLSEFGRLQAGQSVLIHAGAGGVGSVAIPIAKHLGATVFTTASTKNHDYVCSLGADHVIDYQHQDYVSYVRQHAPDGLDMVLQSLLNDQASIDAINLVRDGGAVAYMNNEPPAMEAIEQRSIRAEFIHHRPDGESLRDLLALFSDEILPKPTIELLSLGQIVEAHKRSEAARTVGKLVLKIQDLPSG